MLNDYKKPVYPHETPEFMKMSLRMFVAMIQTSDRMGNLSGWWENHCLDMCHTLESHDGDEEWLKRKWAALEEVTALFDEAIARGL